MVSLQRVELSHRLPLRGLRSRHSNLHSAAYVRDATGRLCLQATAVVDVVPELLVPVASADRGQPEGKALQMLSS